MDLRKPSYLGVDGVRKLAPAFDPVGDVAGSHRDLSELPRAFGSQGGEEVTIWTVAASTTALSRRFI